MIFYNAQLMQNQYQLRLYLVTNPIPFKRYEDHEAALQIQLHELVAQAIAQKEDPIALIEGYLQTSYVGDESVASIANFISNSHQMIHALHQLKEHWDELDESLPKVSLKYAGTTRGQANQVFYETSLRSYLEALGAVYDK